MGLDADDATTRGVAFWAKGPGGTTARLRVAFLAPLVGALALIVGAWVLTLYLHMHDEIADETARTRAQIEHVYRDHLTHDARMLEVGMEAIGYDEVLRAALARRDRTALLARAAPLFAELRRKFDITHLYFTGPDRVNLLRVHMPDRHGDRIDRFTTLEAQRTGRTAHGVEMGPLGTFTLRLVTPWYEGGRGRLLGYVELGMEIDRVLRAVQDFTAVPTFALVSKQYLKRADWEAGMKMLGRAPEWDRFPDAVLSTQASEQLPAALAAWLSRGMPAEPATVLELIQARTVFRAALMPLTDVAGRPVGRLVALADMSAYVAEEHEVMYLGSAIGVAVAGVLFGFFFWLAGRIGRRIERDGKELQRLATHDGLTGLYNHRTFHTLLEDELARAKRFDRPVSLLMFDIDHFKRVNDEHGHRAGDRILKGLSDLLGRQARTIDRVCRYGGEEITIILPETDGDAALGIAERLRVAVADQPFDIGDGRTVHIAVSIGLASWPAEAGDAETLIAAADTAMYAAKQAGRNRVCRWESGMAAAGN